MLTWHKEVSGVQKRGCNNLNNRLEENKTQKTSVGDKIVQCLGVVWAASCKHMILPGEHDYHMSW